MDQMKKILTVLVIICFGTAQFAYAGPWTVPKEHVWGQYQIKWNWAKAAFNEHRNSGRFDRDARAWGWGMIPEVHYGLTDDINPFIKLEYKEGFYKEHSRLPAWGPYSVKNHGLTSIEPGVKVRLLKEPIMLSVQAWYSIWNNDYEDLPLQDVAEQPGLSDRTNFLDLRVLFGKYYGTKIPFYWAGEVGYRFNQRNITDQVPLFIEGGFWPLKWLLLKTEVDALVSSRVGYGHLDKSYAIWRVGPSIQLLTIYYMMKGVDVKSKQFTSDVTRSSRSLNLEVQYGNTFWGENTSASQEVILKVSAQY